MARHSAQEQLMLELINHARLDPAAAAASFGISLNKGLPGGTISKATKAPLAANELLVDAARAHSKWMLDVDVFSHTGAGGSSAHQRMQNAGYSFAGNWASGENISLASSASSSSALTKAIIGQHRDLFLSAGHRANILSDNFREVGIGQVHGNFTSGGNTFGASMVTQNFAKSGTGLFLTGVIYKDKSGDKFYSVGEGVSKVSVKAGAASTKSASPGGYQVALTPGDTSVTFGTGSKAVKATAKFLGENAKIDLVDGNHLHSSVSLTLVANVKSATLLGLNNLSLKGSKAKDVLVGNKGKNDLSGGGGRDKLIGGPGADKLDGGSGRDTASYETAKKGVVANLAKGKGTKGDAKGDTYKSIENLTGSSKADTLVGNKKANVLKGGNGNDKLKGGAGNDTLQGGKGADKLYGGKGADAFVFKSIKDSTAASGGRDRIYDFSKKQKDKIDLSAIDANAGKKGNQAFSFIGKAGFTNKAGELRYDTKNGKAYVYGDVNGDGVADFSIRLDKISTLTKGDFVL